eukprot:CAMPEP_0117583612 /NCGR_PEP_ID=MMETSP0784-20121206/67118_1 /TAXON_ID=39447 /ORGANISM="" /LENGTH=60 /DNA_ID=CAMNT_0005384331 /DNA_START=1 /DNA_END=180 /DNA_ORIENTATION=-
MTSISPTAAMRATSHSCHRPHHNSALAETREAFNNTPDDSQLQQSWRQRRMWPPKTGPTR